MKVPAFRRGKGGMNSIPGDAIANAGWKHFTRGRMRKAVFDTADKT
jgi:hypothetical protein